MHVLTFEDIICQLSKVDSLGRIPLLHELVEQDGRGLPDLLKLFGGPRYDRRRVRRSSSSTRACPLSIDIIVNGQYERRKTKQTEWGEPFLLFSSFTHRYEGTDLFRHVGRVTRDPSLAFPSTLDEDVALIDLGQSPSFRSRVKSFLRSRCRWW